MVEPRSSTTSLPTLQTLIAQSAQAYTTQPAQAVQLARRAYELSRIGQPADLAIGDEALGIALLHCDHYRQAAHHLDEAYQTYLPEGDTLNRCRVGIHYVSALIHTGQLQRALQLISEIEPPLARSAKQNRADFRRLAALPLAIGLLQERLGNYEQALAQYDRHTHTLFTLGDADYLARLNIGRARVLAQLGMGEDALSAYAQAEMLLHTTNNQSDLARLYGYRSALLIQMQRYAEAIVAEQQAANLFATLPGAQQIAQSLAILRIQLVLAGWPVGGNGDQKAEYLLALQAAQQSFARHAAVYEESQVWWWLGRWYEQQQDWQAARHAYQQVLQLLPEEGDRLLDFQVGWGLARIAQQEQKIAEAVAYYTNAIDRLAQLRQSLRIEHYRSAFGQDKQAIYGDLTQLLAEQGDWQEAFTLIEQAKARLISEKLAFRLQSEVADAAASDNDQVRHLAQSLQFTLQQLDQFYLQSQATQTSDSTLTWSADISGGESGAIAALENLVQAMVVQIQHLQPVFSTLTIGETITAERLQEQVGDGIFLQYCVVRDRYATFVIDQEGICNYVPLATIEQVAQTRQAFSLAIERVLALARQLTRARLLRHLPNLLEDVNQHLQRLYTLLVQPIFASLPAQTWDENKRLIISPDSILHTLPFHAFYDGQRYLIERMPIQYAPSATVLAACRQRQPAGEGVLLLGQAASGNSLRLTAINDELSALTRFYPTARVSMGDQATTALFLAEAPRCRLLHVASHAAFRRDRPMLSAIALADRNLTLAEIARLQLGADLVVLSGCETGFGHLSGGDLLSLASGFLGAGARSLLVSLWQVEDEATSQLMRAFYQAVQTGDSYTDALRMAQLSLLRGTAMLYRHPAFWAPFNLVGSG